MTKNITLISLVGEQAAPVLLPVYELQPARVVLAATDKTGDVAQRLRLFLAQRRYDVSVIEVDPYDPERAYLELTRKAGAWLGEESTTQLVGNFSGGTKTMALALQRFLASFDSGILCYLQSEGVTNKLYFFNPGSLQQQGDPHEIRQCISIEDHLAIYWGQGNYKVRGPKKGKERGIVFERVVAEALEPYVDELKVGVERQGHDVEIDIIFRCRNQIGIAELKTGKKAQRMEGIQQLSTFGTRTSIGTYVKKFLIIDQALQENDLRALAKALGIKLVELTSFSAQGYLADHDKNRLVAAVTEALGCGKGGSPCLS
ncbi:hypothetical protein [Oceanithermus sp.]